MQNVIVAEGVDAFPENAQIIENYKSQPRELLSLYDGNEYYHSWKRPECLLVKYRREKTYDNHYLDIWICLKHMKETCRCGVEWVYYQQGLYEKYGR